MRLLGNRSPDSSRPSHQFSSHGRRKKRIGPLQKLINRCHFTCVNCSSDTLSIASDVQYHSLIDAPMYLPHRNAPQRPQTNINQEQDPEEDNDLEPEHYDSENLDEDTTDNLSLFSNNRNTSLRRRPPLHDNNQTLNEEDDTHTDVENDVPLVPSRAGSSVLGGNRPSWLPRIALGNENIGTFGNLLGMQSRNTASPHPQVLADITNTATYSTTDQSYNDSVNDDDILITGDFNDNSNPFTNSVNDDEILITGDFNDNSSPCTNNTNDAVEPCEHNQNNSHSIPSVPSDSDFADITSDLLIGSGSTRSSVLIDFTDNFTYEPNSLAQNNLTSNLQNNTQNDDENNDGSLERRLPIHLLSLFENPNEREIRPFNSASRTNHVQVDNQYDDHHQQEADVQHDDNAPFSLQNLFDSPSSETIALFTNHNQSHQNPFSSFFTQSNRDSSNLLNNMNSNSIQRLQEMASNRENVLNQLPSPLLPLNINSNSNRSSSNGSDTRSPLQQNWYIYDPRLVPGNRQDRLNLHMVWRGIHTELSTPAMIGPPAYDELSSHNSDDDGGIPREPPPPYMENIEVSPIPPPPTYDEAVFNSMFAEFERENLGLGPGTNTQENTTSEVPFNSDRYLPNYRPLIIQNAQVFCDDNNISSNNNHENNTQENMDLLPENNDTDDILMDSFNFVNPANRNLNFMGADWNNDDINDAFDSVENQGLHESSDGLNAQAFAFSRFWNRPRWGNTQANNVNFGISCRLRNINGNLF